MLRIYDINRAQMEPMIPNIYCILFNICFNDKGIKNNLNFVSWFNIRKLDY